MPHLNNFRLHVLAHHFQSEPDLSFPGGRGDNVVRRGSERGTGIRKLRSIGNPQRLRTELQLQALLYSEIPKDAGIEIENARPAQDVASTVAECGRGHRGKRVRIKVRLAGSMAAQNTDGGQDLICGLAVAGRIEGRRRSAYGEGLPAGAAHDGVHLPTACERGSNALT